MTYAGGRYKYKIYGIDNGVRIAAVCFREQNPDLQSSYLYNSDGSEVLRHVMLDIDEKNTSPQFKEENGVF